MENFTGMLQLSMQRYREQIVLNYRVVPGYDKDQVFADMQVSVPLTLNTDGILNSDAASIWTYTHHGLN